MRTSPETPCRILAAHDEAPVLERFRQVLAPERETKTAQAPDKDVFELTTCRAEEAVASVARAVEQERPFAVAFLDPGQAPDGSGLEAAREIRGLDPDLLLVVAVDHPGPDSPDPDPGILPADKLLYVQKPIHSREIAQIAACLCAMWRMGRDFKALQAEQEQRVRERTDEPSRAVGDLSASEACYRSIFEHTGAATVIIEPDTTISMANARFEELSGHPRSEIEGVKSWTEFVHPEDLSWMREHHRLRRKDPDNAPESYDFRFVNKAGELRHIRLRLGMLPDGKRSVASLLDITESKKTEQQFMRQALYDKLTRLPNRTLFLDRLERCIKLSRRREDRSFAVLFLDLDRFKIINESLGHTAGDLFLTHIATRLLRTVRAEETLARFGGDEFAILLEEVTDSRDPVHVAERIRSELSTPVEVQGAHIQTTASVGIVLSTGDYENPNQVLRDADIAMYRAKSEGGGRFMVFSKSMHEQAEHLLTLENDLRTAVTKKQFFVQFQPIIRLEDMRVSGFEALVRWQHPERGLITPLEFIPVAEETGLITDIDVWVLDESCRFLAQWRGMGEHARDLTVAVNLSGRDLARESLIRDIRSSLSSAGLTAKDMQLEITESTLLQSGDVAAETLNALRTLSMKLSVDDFGTGYSSLASLKSQPIDSLKIDRSFVADMESSPESMEIVRTIIGLAHLLGLEVIAEGVETTEHLTILKNLDCDYAQGYLFSRPLPPEEVSRLVAEGLDMSGKYAG